MSNVHKSFAALIFGLLIGHIGWIKFSFPSVIYPVDYAERLLIIGLFVYLFRGLGLGPWGRTRHYLAALGLGLLIVACDLMLRAAAYKIGLPNGGDRWPPLHGWPLAFDLTVGLVLGALCEEIVYRKLMADVIATYTQKPVAIYLVSAAVFAVLHLNQGSVSTLNAFVAGLILMFLYRWSGSLSVAVLAHYFANMVFFGILH